MMTTRDEVVATALGYDGICDGQGYDGPNPFSADLGRPAEAWCGDFVTDIYKRAQVPLPPMQPGCRTGFAYCPDAADCGQAHGATRSSWQAEAGDIVLFDWSGRGIAEHTEIVSRYEGGALLTIGGNSGPSNVDGFTGQGGVHRHRWPAPAGQGNNEILVVIDASKLVQFGGPAHPTRPGRHPAGPRLLMLKSPTMSGTDVRIVQQLLNQRGNAGLAADGVFGPLTRQAVISWQRRAQIHVDGIVGPQTRISLGLPGDGQPSAIPGLCYPDISAWQGVMDVSGVHAVCIKRTEGTYYPNPDYDAQVAQAEAAGAFHFAYHLLTDEDPAAQAQFCYGHVGGSVALMVDVETTGTRSNPSNPSLVQNIGFVQHFRQLGGTVHLNYLPRWYWDSVWGRPDLTPLKDLDLVLVSSEYVSYSTGAGWAAYGGWTPTIWQYSKTEPLHGQPVDFNAFLGSGATDIPTLLTELKSVVTTGKFPGGKTWQELDTPGNQSLQQIASACDMSPATILRATAVHYNRYDPVTHDYLDNILTGTIKPTASMPAGGKLWILK
jgi:hypothetical protein